MISFLGPVFLPNRLNRFSETLYFVEGFNSVLESVPLHQVQETWFVHDGAIPHFPLIVRQHLNQTFGVEW